MNKRPIKYQSTVKRLQGHVDKYKTRLANNPANSNNWAFMRRFNKLSEELNWVKKNCTILEDPIK